jgi:SAM-dependent methyltransferase
VRTRLLYGSTIFSGSLLLFLIQPIMAKAILPWFGGAAGVWACALFFFQAALLAGYGYAWWSARHLTPRGQAAVQLLLLAASLLLLPVAPRASWKPAGPDEPAARIVGLLAASVGLPYFLLAANGPLAQVWFARRAKPAFPYRLFALSNLASLAALLLYPVGIEPLLSVSHQLRWWSAAYAAFAVLAGSAAVIAARGPLGGSLRPALPDHAAPGIGWQAGPEGTPPAPPRSGPPVRLLWFALAACPSILWMATANTLSQSIAPIPFLWILPLSVYLLSLILCFDRQGWYRPPIYRVALPASCILMAWCAGDRGAGMDVQWTIGLFAAALFVCCMFCHGELARRKPDADLLPSFYLTLAAGGAAGGLFVGILAPLLFSGFLELPIGVTVCVLLAMGLLYGVRSPRRLVRLSLFAAAGFVVALQMDARFSQTRVRVRNFYGALRVNDKGEVRILANGAIHHGAQFLAPAKERVATTYYGRDSGVGRAIAALPAGPRRVGAIGLGTGTLAAYARPGDDFRFYEINSAVIELARTQFRFLRDCAGSVEVVPGDGRLSLERETAQRFDLLAVDAFSGDAIPVHLLTAEAFRLYLSRLKPGGVLALHITNRYLNLAPVVLALAAHAGIEARVVRNAPDPDEDVYEATWVVARAGGSSKAPAPAARVWTDDYSNLLGALK